MPCRKTATRLRSDYTVRSSLKIAAVVIVVIMA